SLAYRRCEASPRAEVRAGRETVTANRAAAWQQGLLLIATTSRNAMVAQRRGHRLARSYVPAQRRSILPEGLGGECERVAPRQVIEHVGSEDQLVWPMAGGEIGDAFAHVGSVAHHRAGQRLLHHRLFLRRPERLDVVDRRR